MDMEDVFEAKRLSGKKLTVQRFRNGGSVLDGKFRDSHEHTDEEFSSLLIQIA
jgi:hypothetical protein